ncbi:hypothetical protein WA026_015133 [Henosepilachna vigintioctopunctata]|uniref:Uncharacterized protein n=1 Tax=Henosepilachna vigintioctopunctata TaxID=420089 RepID=A0AAW1TU29_9CUCU
MIAGLADFESTYAYEGFNPFTMRKIIIEYGGGNFKSDLPILILLYLQRGTNIRKAVLMTGEDGAAKMRELVARYKIAKPGTKLRRQTVTMARIASSYPDAIAQVINRNYQIYKGPLQESEEDLYTHHFTCMMCGNFTSPYKIREYQKISLNSNLIEENVKLELMVTLGFAKKEQDGFYAISALYDTLEDSDDDQSTEIKEPVARFASTSTSTKRPSSRGPPSKRTR